MVGFRPPTLEERQLAWLWGTAVAAALVLIPFWRAIAPLLPPCPFRAVTGLPCPTCGTTRAAVKLMEGSLLAALSCNPLAAVAGIAFVAGGVAAPLWLLVRLPVPDLSPVLPRWVRVATVALLLANWAWVIWKS